MVFDGDVVVSTHALKANAAAAANRDAIRWRGARREELGIGLSPAMGRARQEGRPSLKGECSSSAALRAAYESRVQRCE
jgi:hypothetical protein